MAAPKELLERLGVKTIALPVPFPDAGGPVNVYAIEEEGGGICLFDAGIGGKEGQATFEQAAASAGIDLDRVKRIVVSHGHVDHFGNARYLVERTGCSVLVHEDDWEKVVGSDRWKELKPLYARYFRKLGVPASGIEHLENLRSYTTGFAGRIPTHNAQKLEAGTRLRFRRFEAEVLHLPGHTPGLVCLWDEKHRLFFADDHVLARVSPNPLLDLKGGSESRKFRALVAYLNSAREVAAMDIDWVLPGHGAPFQGHRAVLESLFEFYERRQERLLAFLRHTPATAYDLIPVVFGQLDPSKLFLKLSEVVGNLEVLEFKGWVGRQLREGTWIFEAGE